MVKLPEHGVPFNERRDSTELYQIPYKGPGATGLGKPLKSTIHPRRKEIPIFLGAEGPKNVAMAAEIAGNAPLTVRGVKQVLEHVAVRRDAAVLRPPRLRREFRCRASGR